MGSSARVAFVLAGAMVGIGANAQMVFLPDNNSRGILKFDVVTGTYRGIIGAGFFAGGVSPAIAQSPIDGYLYVGAFGSSGGSILRFDPYTGQYAGMLGNGFISAPDDLAFGADGTLYVANYAGGNRNILRFNAADGTYRGLFASNFYGGALASLATLGDHVYVSENNAIYRFDGPTGQYLGVFASGFIPGAAGLAFGASDTIYAGSSNNDAVAKFTGPTGQYRGLIMNLWADTVLGLDTYGDDQVAIRVINYGGATQSVLRFDGPTGQYKGLFAANFGLSGNGLAIEQPALVTGTLTLENYSGAARLVDWEVVDGMGTVLDSGQFGPTTGGAFSFKTTARGTYDIKLKASHWLKRSSAAVVIGRGGASGLSFSLLNGDVNNNNEVGPEDFALLSIAFGSFLGDPNYNAEADLNGDEEVGPADFAILASNFGEFGD